MDVVTETRGLSGHSRQPRTGSDGHAISGQVTSKKLRALIERQGYCCALSGRELTPDNVQADHVLPVAMGGSHDMSNVQLLVDRVNAAKGGMTQQEFIDMCCDVADWHRRRGGVRAPPVGLGSSRPCPVRTTKSAIE